MRHEEFSIGMEFVTDTGRWRCTDVGSRTIVAIKISEVTVTARKDDGNTTTTTEAPPDPSWFNGPPYAVAEHVFDEEDLLSCRRRHDDLGA